MTAIRSDISSTSSSSAETSSTAVPASRLAMTWRWMNSMLPTSRPRVGWSRTRSFSGRSNSRATTTFCWLPPDRVATGSAAGADVEGDDAVHRIARDGSLVAQHPVAVRRTVVAGEHEVVGDAERQDEPEPLAVRGHEADAGLGHAAGTQPRHILPVECHMAARDLPETDDRLDHLVLAVARHARDTQDLASLDLEGRRLRPPRYRGRPSHADHVSRASPRRGVTRLGRRSAAHHGRPSAARGPPHRSRWGCASRRPCLAG